MPIDINFKKIVSVFAILLLGIVYWQTISAPSVFPVNSIISIREGAGLLEVSDTLKKDMVIRSPFWFRTSAIFLGGERGLQAGDYYLPNKENSLHIAWRVVHGDKKLETVKVTIPEGFTNQQIGDLFEKKFPRFNKEDFLKKGTEGYMFPDTYFMEITADATSTIKILSDNFQSKLNPYNDEIDSSTTYAVLDELITVASIVEAEARTKEDREIVAGILLKRWELGMPLQADSTLKYVTGKKSNELTLDDLKSNSPYNSYKQLGLPPTPISNPGLESILAALRPLKTPYLYFLTDAEGKMHYAATFAEHKKNKEKYLSK